MQSLKAGRTPRLRSINEREKEKKAIKRHFGDRGKTVPFVGGKTNITRKVRMMRCHKDHLTIMVLVIKYVFMFLKFFFYCLDIKMVVRFL